MTFINSASAAQPLYSLFIYVFFSYSLSRPLSQLVVLLATNNVLRTYSTSKTEHRNKSKEKEKLKAKTMRKK